MKDTPIIDKIDSALIYIVGNMIENKVKEIQHTLELSNGQRFKFYIRELNKGKQ